MVKLNIKLPEGFLEEEEICGFPVTRERKELWAVELDLLNEFIRVCEENGLHYVLGAGSLLGAVRHQGFIPWDDDIDVYMLREDYDKLMALADSFQPPYFLQNWATDPNYTLGHSKLRNSNTTGCPRKEMDRNMNRGLYLDIFPLDGVSADPEEDRVQTERNKNYREILWRYRCTHVCMVTGDSPRQKLQSLCKRTVSFLFREGYLGFGRRKDELCREYDENMKKYSVEGTELWGNRTLVFECPLSRRPIEDWLQLTTAKFEFLTVSIPQNYDEILRQQYGNYMELPKNKRGGSVHGELIISTDIPYAEYFGKKGRN